MCYFNEFISLKCLARRSCSYFLFCVIKANISAMIACAEEQFPVTLKNEVSFLSFHFKLNLSIVIPDYVYFKYSFVFIESNSLWHMFIFSFLSLNLFLFLCFYFLVHLSVKTVG